MLHNRWHIIQSMDRMLNGAPDRKGSRISIKVEDCEKNSIIVESFFLQIHHFAICIIPIILFIISCYIIYYFFVYKSNDLHVFYA